jgi:hypothetical protein
MLSEASQIITELTSRLPELEWKISSLNSSFLNQHVPPGLFGPSKEITGNICIEQIQADIQLLSQQNNERSALYLAQKIQHKVNVLVALCRPNPKNKSHEKVYFGVNRLATRQQWIGCLEAEVQSLESQRQALTRTLDQMTNRHEISESILQLKADLGEVERHLTLAQEALKRVIS